MPICATGNAGDGPWDGGRSESKVGRVQAEPKPESETSAALRVGLGEWCPNEGTAKPVCGDLFARRQWADYKTKQKENIFF